MNMPSLQLISVTLIIHVSRVIQGRGLAITVSTVYGALHERGVLRCSFKPSYADVAHIIWRKGAHPMGKLAFYFGTEKSQESSPTEYIKGRYMTGFFNQAEGYHEITIHNPVEEDEGLYSCTIMLKNSHTDLTSSGHLTLVVLAAKGPEIRDRHGIVLSNVPCHNESNIPEWNTTLNGSMSLVCHAYETNPKSTVTWSCQDSSSLEEINRTSITIAKRRIAVESSIQTVVTCGHRAMLKCIVYSANPKIKKPIRTDICLFIRRPPSSCMAEVGSYVHTNIWMTISIVLLILTVLLTLMIIIMCLKRPRVKESAKDIGASGESQDKLLRGTYGVQHV